MPIFPKLGNILLCTVVRIFEVMVQVTGSRYKSEMHALSITISAPPRWVWSWYIYFDSQSTSIIQLILILRIKYTSEGENKLIYDTFLLNLNVVQLSNYHTVARSTPPDRPIRQLDSSETVRIRRKRLDPRVDSVGFSSTRSGIPAGVAAGRLGRQL